MANYADKSKKEAQDFKGQFWGSTFYVRRGKRTDAQSPL